VAASTPENKVKKKVKGLLAEYTMLYSNWPVPAGYGTPTLDCIGCHYGLFFAVETKAPGKKPTPRQAEIIRQMVEAGAAVFVVDGDASMEPLKDWLDAVSARNSRGQHPA
jgi:hypothetical protein